MIVTAVSNSTLNRNQASEPRLRIQSLVGVGWEELTDDCEYEPGCVGAVSITGVLPDAAKRRTARL